MTDERAALSLSRHLPKGAVLGKLRDSHWRKELLLVVNILRGASCGRQGCIVFAASHASSLLASGQPQAVCTDASVAVVPSFELVGTCVSG